jgi:hypothetical protein
MRVEVDYDGYDLRQVSALYIHFIWTASSILIPIDFAIFLAVNLVQLRYLFEFSAPAGFASLCLNFVCVA